MVSIPVDGPGDGALRGVLDDHLAPARRVDLTPQRLDVPRVEARRDQLAHQEAIDAVAHALDGGVGDLARQGVALGGALPVGHQVQHAMHRARVVPLGGEHAERGGAQVEGRVWSEGGAEPVARVLLVPLVVPEERLAEHGALHPRFAPHPR